MQTTLLALWGMARPLIMLSVILVYIAGIIMAYAQGYALAPMPIAWGFTALMLVSLSIHYTNEYADVETDALTRKTLYSGGSGVLPGGTVPRQLAMQAAWITMLLGVGVGLVALLYGYLPLVSFILLLLGTAGGWMYSLPPLKLAWRGWGEVDNALLGGLLLPLYAYTSLSQRLDVNMVIGLIPLTLLVFLNLLATTWADREADQQVGKFTLATFVPLPRLRLLYTLVLISAYLCLFLCLPREVMMGSLFALPVSLWGWRTYTRLHSPYPTSNAMLVLLIGQMAAWLIVAG